MPLYYIRITEQLERSGGEAVHAENTVEAIKEVEERLKNGTLNGSLEVSSRQVSYSIDYEGGV